MTPERLAEIEARHVKVEDVIFDGPVCRTCRHIDGAAVSFPCDAAIILTALREAQTELADDAKWQAADAREDNLHKDLDRLGIRRSAVDGACDGSIARIRWLVEDRDALQQRAEALEQAINLALQFAGPRVGEGEVSVTEDWQEWDKAYRKIAALRGSPENDAGPYWGPSGGGMG